MKYIKLGNMKNLKIILYICLFTSILNAQSIAVTIDDVPNSKNYKLDNFKSVLLDKLNSHSVPATIFINERLLYTTDNLDQNFALLHKWCKDPLITLGNHTFSHLRCSTSDLEMFKRDVLKGEAITEELAKVYKKELKYFRFPYNDLGKDSLHQKSVEEFLTSEGYVITPFTVESSDWIFNALYEHHLKVGNKKKAQYIGEKYVEKTLEYFDYFETVTQELYGRRIDHIYLCHDNRLNADYLDKLILQLREKGYKFVSLDTALKDKVYSQEIYFHKKWGISWVYRWLKNKKVRSKLMKAEPDIMEFYKLYQELTKQKTY